MVDTKNIIFDTVDFWIESIQFDNFVAAAAVENHDLTLKRAGRFVGVASSPWISNAISSDMIEFTISIKKTDATMLEYGDEISQIRLTLVNNSAGGNVLDANIVLMMRK